MFGAYLFARARTRLPAERVSLLICPVAIFVTLALLAIKIEQSPYDDWNAGRLAPVMGLLSGAKLFVGRDGPGAVMNTIYPPLAYLVYAPAGLFTDPTYAIMAASCVGVSLFYRPAVAPGFGGIGGTAAARLSLLEYRQPWSASSRPPGSPKGLVFRGVLDSCRCTDA